jgi:hypothetical protein
MTTTINASTSSGLVNTADTSGILQLQTASTAAVTINASQLVGVGTNNPQYSLDVQATTGEQIARFRATTTTNQSYITVSNAGAMYVGLDNSTGSAITNSAYAPFIYSSTDAPMSFFTNGTRTVTFQQNGAVTLKGATQTSSGTGITFPATQSASSDANTLDDYEEGTWTPNQGAGLTVVGSFSSNGTYTKIGNIVSVQGQVSGSTSVAATSVGLICSNLPFTSINVTGSRGTGGAFNATGASPSITFGNNGATTVYVASSIAATAQIFFSIVYQTA